METAVAVTAAAVAATTRGWPRAAIFTQASGALIKCVAVASTAGSSSSSSSSSSSAGHYK